MKINIINISPKHSAIWKCGNFLCGSFKKNKNIQIRFLDLWTSKRVSHNKFIRSLQLIKGIKLNTKKDEINYYTGPLLSNSIHKSKSKKNIVFIHDLCAFKEKNILLKFLSKYLYSRSRIADIIITNSESTKKEFVDYYNYTGNIYSNLLGIENNFFKNGKIADVKKNEIFTLLSIGRDEPRKNLKFMLTILTKLNFKYKLIRIDKFSKTNQEYIKKENLDLNILIKEKISEEELIKLYKKSDMLLFPSLYEGFGLPPIEAMACGCIPLVSNMGSLPEVVNNSYLITELAEELWVKKIKEIYYNKELKEKLIKYGLNYSKKFTWKNHNEVLLEILRKNV